MVETCLVLEVSVSHAFGRCKAHGAGNDNGTLNPQQYQFPVEYKMAQPMPARSWNPNFLHSDRERWICIYPAYINSKKTIREGRRVPKVKAVENPSYIEIRDVCASAGFTMGVENKVYPRELDHRDAKFRGRIRIQLRDDEGSPLDPKFPTRDSILDYIGETIPKLKSRLQSQSSSQASSQQQQSGKGQKKKGRKGK